MSATVKDLNIYQRLAKIRELVEVLQKNEDGYNYKYVTEDEILARVTGGMRNYHISLIPSIIPGTYEVSPNTFLKTRFTKNGEKIDDTINEWVVHGEMVYRWICDDNPESFIDVPWIFVGSQSEPSQAFGSALTYCNRYFLMKYFNVSTVEDDPDSWKATQKEAEQNETIQACAVLAEKLAGIISEYVEKNSDNPEVRKEIAKFLKGILKNESGKSTVNYYDVKDPAILEKAIKEFSKKYIEENKGE